MAFYSKCVQCKHVKWEGSKWAQARLLNRLGMLRNTGIPQVMDPTLVQNDHFRGSSRDQLGLERRKEKTKKEKLIKCK